LGFVQKWDIDDIAWYNDIASWYNDIASMVGKLISGDPFFRQTRFELGRSMADVLRHIKIYPSQHAEITVQPILSGTFGGRRPYSDHTGMQNAAVTGKLTNYLYHFNPFYIYF